MSRNQSLINCFIAIVAVLGVQNQSFAKALSCPKGTAVDFVIKNAGRDLEKKTVDSILSRANDDDLRSKPSAAIQSKLNIIDQLTKSLKKGDSDNDLVDIGEATLLYGGICNDETGALENRNLYYYSVQHWNMSTGGLDGFLKVLVLGPCNSQPTGKSDVHVCVLGTANSIDSTKRD